MLESDQKEFYLYLKDALEIKNRPLSGGAFKLWCKLLAPYHLEDIKNAIDQALANPSFMLEPAKILEFLPNALGHPTPEIAWTLYPKLEQDAGYVTDEIMQAGQSINPLDKMARMPFLEAYKQILANAKMNQKPAKWFYSSSSIGTHEERKETKIVHTLEAMQCGRLTRQKAENTVRLLCNELDKPLTHYLPNLPAPKETMKLEDQRRQIGIISNKISKALSSTLENSSSTNEEERAARVKKIKAELDAYKKEDDDRDKMDGLKAKLA